jgi:glycosyltransferase involved in cell wall biosynthesis
MVKFHLNGTIERDFDIYGKYCGSPKMKIKVTIGVCARNCKNDVSKIINRISSQDFPHENIEVLFVDDGSQDDTLSSILQFAQRMNMNFKVYHHAWRGLGYSRNIALTNAQGDYIVWVDDGTIIPKDYVRKQIEFIEKNPSLGIIRGLVGVYTGSNPVAALENMSRLVFDHKYAGKITSKLPGAAGAIYRIKAAKQVGGFNETIHGAGEDTDIAYRIFSAGWQILITPAEFTLEYNESLKKAWSKSYWYGYGTHFTLHKHKGLHELLYKSTPVAGFLEGVLIFSIAYRLTHKKIAFLLPIYYFSKRIMWCFGFAKSHIDSYGHIKGGFTVSR